MKCNYTQGKSRYYTDDCKGCKFVYDVFGKKVCGKCDGRVALHQRIRTELGCVGCDYYTNKIDSKTCEKCIRGKQDE